MNYTDPLFKSVFNEHWEKIAPVMHKRYSNRSNSDDVVTVKGEMNVYGSSLYICFYHLLKFFGIKLLPPGKHIPVLIHYRSKLGCNSIYFERIFYYPNQKIYRFSSKMQPIKDNQVIEFLGFNVGCKLNYELDKNVILLQPKGYGFKIGNYIVSLPLTWIIGKVTAHEKAISENTFFMEMQMNHPLFGRLFGYDGKFSPQ